MVKGREIQVNEDILGEVIGLSIEREWWFEVHTSLHNPTPLFVNLGEELVRKGKGYNPNSLREPWKELVGIVQW